MTPEANIQTVQSGYAAFGRGDIAGVLATLAPSIEWTTPASVPMGCSGTVKGHAGVAQFFGAVAEAWNFEFFEPRQFIASGDNVVVIGHYRAKARSTGRTVECDWVMTWQLQDGKVVRFQEFTDTAVLRDALSAAASA